MKRLVCVGVLLVLATCLAQAQITIGVNVSETGPASSLGIPNKNGIVLVGPKEIAGQKIHYIFLDDQSDPTISVQNVKRLITEDHADVILGPSVTPNSMAVVGVAAAAQTPLISFGSATAIVAPINADKKWIFKTVPNDNQFGDTVFGNMVKQHVKTLSVIAVQDAYGETWVDIAKKEAAARGLKILSIERYQRTDTSTIGQALRVIQGHPDAVLISCAGTCAVTPERDLYEHGYKGLVYQSGGAVNSDFLSVGGKAVNGGYAPTPPLIVAQQLPNGYPVKAHCLEFLKAYEAKYGPVSQYAGHSADSISLLKVAIPVALKKAKPGTVAFREALRNALENDCKDVKGVQGIYTMSPTNHSGVSTSGMVLVQVVNDTWKLDAYPKF